MPGSMTSMERVLCTLRHQEPDRVPVFLQVSMHGARELGMGLREYFRRGEHVAEGQRRLRAKYAHDSYYAFLYAAIEHEAFGGEALFSEDGPVNAGAPVILRRRDIFDLEVPDIGSASGLQETLKAIRLLKDTAAGEVPVLGVVMSPFSLPVMLMGFPAYLDLLHDDQEGFERLMAVTTAFSVEWARAQFDAGATAITYFDPLSAADITDSVLFERTGCAVTSATIPRLGGPTALHLGSGRVLDRMEWYCRTGAVALGVGAFEDLASLKRQATARVALLGNLNGIRLASASPQSAAQETEQCIRVAAAGGGFILSDGHGEIPWQVAEEVLMAVMETARTAGRYPIQGLANE